MTLPRQLNQTRKEASEAEQDFNSESIELFVLLMFKDISIMQQFVAAGANESFIETMRQMIQEHELGYDEKILMRELQAIK